MQPAGATWWGRNTTRVALFLWAVLAGLTFDPKPSTGGDDATCVPLARARASGQGLFEMWTVGTPARVQHPFGFPLLLAPLVALGVSFGVLKLVVIAAGLAQQLSGLFVLPLVGLAAGQFGGVLKAGPEYDALIGGIVLVLDIVIAVQTTQSIAR